FIIALLITLITGRNIFKASSKVLVFFFFFLFGLSSITYCYLVSVFFSRAKTAATVGVVLFLATFFPWFAVNGADMSNSSKGAASLLSTTAFGLGLDQLAAYEDNGQGISFGNASTVVRNYSMSTALIMMAFDFFLYAFLAWYIDAVLPASWREFGVSRPWNFPCTRAYWKETCTCCSRKKAYVQPLPVSNKSVHAGVPSACARTTWWRTAVARVRFHARPLCVCVCHPALSMQERDVCTGTAHAGRLVRHCGG
ncbi:hypothetical protein EON62_01915, partial [archaeon]